MLIPVAGSSIRRSVHPSVFFIIIIVILPPSYPPVCGAVIWMDGRLVGQGYAVSVLAEVSLNLLYASQPNDRPIAETRGARQVNGLEC